MSFVPLSNFQGEAPDRDDTFELCYNYSSLLIAKGDLDKAQKKLEKAEGKNLNPIFCF